MPSIVITRKFGRPCLAVGCRKCARQRSRRDDLGGRERRIDLIVNDLEAKFKLI
jgi:hypothetical protein